MLGNRREMLEKKGVDLAFFGVYLKMMFDLFEEGTFHRNFMGMVRGEHADSPADVNGMVYQIWSNPPRKQQGRCGIVSRSQNDQSQKEIDGLPTAEHENLCRSMCAREPFERIVGHHQSLLKLPSFGCGYP